MRGISMSDSTIAAFSRPAARALEAVLGERHAVAFAHQQALRDAAHRERIVDHQHQRRCRRLGSTDRLRGSAAASPQRAPSRARASPYSVASATGL
jgi:hypothetical protein